MKMLNKINSSPLSLQLCCKLHRLQSCTTRTLPRPLRLRLAENLMAVSIIGLLLITCPVFSAFALEEDQTKPMYIQADSVSVDNKTGESEYNGNVTVIQGTTHLIANKAIVYLESGNSGIKEAVASGNEKTQAHYWTLTDPKKPELNAYADTIRIFPKKHLVYLIGHAKVIQGEDSYEAPEIQYDSEKQRAFSPKSNQGKTIIVIHPSQMEKK